MPSLAEVVARAYSRGLLPGRVASGAFWRLSDRNDVDAVVMGRVTIGTREMRLTLPLRHHLNRTILFGSFDRSPDGPLLRHFAEKAKTARSVVDIGANVGLYSLYAVAYGPPDMRVLAVEPNRPLVDQLVVNVEANALPIDVVRAAVSDQLGEVELHVGRSDLVSSLEAAHVDRYGGAAHVERVPAVTLDGLLAERGVVPDLVKIDVEGHELGVLAGAGETLQQARPVVFIEATPETAGAVRDVMLEHGYSGRRLADSDLVALGEPLVPVGQQLANFVYEPSGPRDVVERADH